MSTHAKHKVVTPEQWIAARKELLEAEKALTRRSDELARWRQELPWIGSEWRRKRIRLKKVFS